MSAVRILRPLLGLACLIAVAGLLAFPRKGFGERPAPSPAPPARASILSANPSPDMAPAPPSATPSSLLASPSPSATPGSALAPRLAPATLPARSVPLVGVNSHFYFLDDDQAAHRALEMYRRAGGRFLRECITWGSVEPKPGAYDWSKADRLVQLAEQHDLSLVVVITHAPRWAWKRGLPLLDLAAFERFMQAAAQRYRGRVEAWQIWNEVDNPAFWAGRMPFAARVEAYAQVLQAGSRGARKGDPGALVLLSGLAMADRIPVFEAPDKKRPAGSLRRVVGTRPLPPGEDSLSFAKALLARPGVRGSFDAASAHMLRADHERQLAPLERMLAQVAPGTPLWITETGVPSGAQAGATPEEQAHFLEHTYRWAAATGIQALFVFELVDHPAEPDNPEAYFGLLSRQIQPKPAFRAFSRLLEIREGEARRNPKAARSLDMAASRQGT